MALGNPDYAIIQAFEVQKVNVPDSSSHWSTNIALPVLVHAVTVEREAADIPLELDGRLGNNPTIRSALEKIRNGIVSVYLQKTGNSIVISKHEIPRMGIMERYSREKISQQNTGETRARGGHKWWNLKSTEQGESFGPEEPK